MTDEDEMRARAIGSEGEEVRAILERVAKLSGIPAKAILSPTRKRPIARARQLVMFIAHRDGVSLPVIGRALNRDHTSVLHGVRAERERRTDG